MKRMRKLIKNFKLGLINPDWVQQQKTIQRCVIKLNYDAGDVLCEAALTSMVGDLTIGLKRRKFLGPNLEINEQLFCNNVIVAIIQTLFSLSYLMNIYQTFIGVQSFDR